MKPQGKGKTPRQIRAEKILASLGYGPGHLIKFQSHWNHVVASGMISGAPLVRDGAWGRKSYEALEAAYEYMSNKPKDWMYYVHKAIQIGPQAKKAMVRMPATRPVRHRRRR